MHAHLLLLAEVMRGVEGFGTGICRLQWMVVRSSHLKGAFSNKLLNSSMCWGNLLRTISSPYQVITQCCFKLSVYISR